MSRKSKDEYFEFLDLQFPGYVIFVFVKKESSVFQEKIRQLCARSLYSGEMIP